MYKLCYIYITLLHILYMFNYKLSYLTPEKLAAETYQDLATLYPTGMSVLYSAQCTCTSLFCVKIYLKSFVFYFAC